MTTRSTGRLWLHAVRRFRRSGAPKRWVIHSSARARDPRGSARLGARSARAPIKHPPTVASLRLAPRALERLPKCGGRGAQVGRNTHHGARRGRVRRRQGADRDRAARGSSACDGPFVYASESRERPRASARRRADWRPPPGAAITLRRCRGLGSWPAACRRRRRRHAASAAGPIRLRAPHPERTALYEIVRDNLETLYGAIEDGALEVRLPKHAKKELEAFLDCGLLCRGFARLRCEGCEERRLVAFCCKGRGFCPSCLGRRMCARPPTSSRRCCPRSRCGSGCSRSRSPGAGGSQRTASCSAPSPASSSRAWRGSTPRAARRTEQRRQDRRGDGRAAHVERLAAHPHLHVVFFDGSYHEQATSSRGTSSGTSGRARSARSSSPPSVA